MAIIQLSELIAAIRGSIRGTTYSRNAAGLVAKNKINGRKSYSSKQSNVIKVQSFIVGQWQQLTSEQQSLWNDYAALYPQIDRFGTTKQLSGFNWFTHVNNLAKQNLDIVIDEPQPRESAILVPSYFVELSIDTITLLFNSLLEMDDHLLFVFASQPTNQTNKTNRGALRLLTVVENPSLTEIDVTSVWSQCFGFDYDSITDNSLFNIQFFIYSINTNSWQNSVGVWSVGKLGEGAPLLPLTLAWIAATGETDPIIISALNKMERRLGLAGLIPKIMALYPFVGGNATKHKFNFMDAADTDAAFRLVFYGGWTHNSDGITGNAINTFADTFIDGATHLTPFDSSVHYYSGTANTADEAEFGYYNPQNYWGSINYGGRMRGRLQRDGANDCNSTPADTTGFYSWCLRNDSYFANFRNGTQLAGSPNTTTDSMPLDNLNIYLGAVHFGSGILFPNQRTCSFFSLGVSLTDSEELVLNSIVQQFQTTLGRNV